MSSAGPDGPRTRGLATGLSATRAPISERPAVVSWNRRVPNLLLQQRGKGHDECRTGRAGRSSDGRD